MRRCLASVCGQTLQEIEIICINDGSTDDSLDILHDLAAHDNRMIVLDQKNEGVANARNRGLERATAPYIGFVDSDDFIAPDMYEKMFNAMTENDADFVECGVERFLAYKRDNTDGERNSLSSRNLSGKVEDVPAFIMSSSGVVWRTLFKKDLIIKAHLKFAENYNGPEDKLFICSYKSISRSGFYINENLYMHFLYENSIMGKMTQKQERRVTEFLETIQLYYLFLKGHGCFEQQKDVFWVFFTEQINTFYNYSTPEIIQSHGINIIRDLLENNDILKLVNEKNKAFRGFLILDKHKLIKPSFLNKRKMTVKKIIKYLLPYALVRWIQENRFQKERQVWE